MQARFVKAGAHVDLVGAFTPGMREVDDALVQDSRIFVDTFAGALAEAGDLVQALAAGLISRQDILGELADLTCGRHPGRGSSQERTLFKSVGTAVEDLAAASYVMKSARR